MKILVTGITGQVGWELMRSLQPLGEVIGVNSQQMNLADPDAIRKTIREIQPGLIVNPAAYTAVDKAESEPKLAMQINGIAPGILAEEAKRLGAPLIHYSTDYVFDGTKDCSYTELDTPNPKSIYGHTKLAGELAIRAVDCEHLIIRTSWVYAARGKNFLRTILRLAQERETLRIVADQFGAPTSARLIADITGQIIKFRIAQRNHISERTIYNLSSYGETSWYEFAQTIIQYASVQFPNLLFKVREIQPISSTEYPSPAPRPRNSRLNCTALNKYYQIHFPNWDVNVYQCLDEMKDRSVQTKTALHK